MEQDGIWKEYVCRRFKRGCGKCFRSKRFQNYNSCIDQRENIKKDIKKHPFVYAVTNDIFIDENGNRHVYYCTNRDEGNITDYVGYRTASYTEKGGWDWSEMEIVLGPTQGTWDQRHTCDPSIVKGEFSYKGEQYNYLMAFLGSI